MTHYAALDVSLRSVHVCVIDTEGKIKAETKLSSEVEDIRTYLNGLDLEIAAVGFEAPIETGLGLVPRTVAAARRAPRALQSLS